VAGALLALPLAAWLFTTGHTGVADVLNFPVLVFVSMWIGPGASTIQELVLAARHVARDEASRLARAQAAGEPGLAAGR
jgi:hypothetical protein